LFKFLFLRNINRYLLSEKDRLSSYKIVVICIEKFLFLLFIIISVDDIGKSVKVLDKVGARTSALDALEKLGAAQTTHLKNRSSFKQLRTHAS
jgi:hypothetical protein